MPLEGQQLGHYRLVRLIGSGGMGEVYLARDTRINREVAIKVIRTEVAPYPNANGTKEAARLFQREMRAITMLDHPNILPLYDFDEENINKTTFTYMVMPYRREGSLSDWLQQRSNTYTLSPQDVAYFISQAADALQHAHDKQIIHQDVKPSNFLIRSKAGDPNHPDLLLADFGIAKFTTTTATASQSIRGTPTCTAHGLNVSDFAFEVQMTIIKGDCGGLGLRVDIAKNNSYILQICADGHYKLLLYVKGSARTMVMQDSVSTAFHTGVGQTNLIAIVATGPNFSLYINHQFVNKGSDSANTLSSGLVGVSADSNSNPTEVAYSDARVWTL